MTTKAYFMIDVAEKSCRNGYQDILKDLVAIPEVETIERIDGICDLMVKVETPLETKLVANKIMPKEWVKSLRLVNVEPAEPSKAKELVGEYLAAQTSSNFKQKHF